jgi:hypothetical protein
MTVLYLILFLLALVCFVASAFQVHSPRVYLVSLGLALWVAAPFIQTLQKV